MVRPTAAVDAGRVNDTRFPEPDAETEPKHEGGTVVDLVARWSVALDERDAERPAPGSDAQGYLSERLARLLQGDEPGGDRRRAS